MVTPHLSTGGMPQYVLKMVQLHKDQCNIEVVEVNNLSNDYVIQRDRIKKECKLHQLEGNQSDLVNLVKKENYDVIHFQEIPETFLDIDVLKQLYTPDREYGIVVTTHSSYTNPQTIQYTADKFILVSEWSRKVFDDYYKGNVLCDVWEYPVDKKEYDKAAAKKQMHFDPAYKHVLHVGLFTPGKNQKELIDIAATCLKDKVKFHFVGNQAGNFEDYWKPLMERFPGNCIWHGERQDVESFYKAADAFYFPSLFELNPLAIKEAISYGVPILIRKLHTYEDTYDGIATYLSDDIVTNKSLLLNVLGIEEVKMRIQAMHLLTVTTHKREIKSIEYISQLQKYGIDYHQIVNKPYDDIPPADFCRRPENIGGKSEYLGDGLGVLTGRHYGNYRAHIDAISSIDTSKYDYTLIFEADANLECTPEEFLEIVYKACHLADLEDSPYISFSNNPSGHKSIYDKDFYLTSPNQDLAHAYLVPSRDKQWYLDRIIDCPWDGYDVWLNDVFYKFQRKRFTTTNCWSNQIEGLSLIDPVVKWVKDKTHYDYVEIGTSDFDTLVEIYPDGYTGLSIEPIRTYLDRLPDKQGNTKLNVAITDEDCELSVYYVKPEDIEKHQLPEWVKGCNSVGAPHPSVVRELTQRGLMDIYTHDIIQGMSFPSLIKEAKIGSVDYLKVDTEGHDFVILRSMLKTDLRPTKIRFEANSLYKEEDIQDIISELSSFGYKLVQRTIDDVVVRLEVDADNTPYTAPVLIISSGRRYSYFSKTLSLLVEKNPDIAQIVKKVWVLDDRSTAGDKVKMHVNLTGMFGDKWNMISFNSEKPFDFVDKFRMIKNLVDPTDVVFLLEDDWECHDYLHLPYHINRLQNSNWTQIAFADPLEIQNADIQNLTRIDGMYWKNPFPNSFKHPIRWNGDMCWWSMGVINNYTNNPSLIKGSVFHQIEYIKHKNFEASFADRLNGNQVFTQEALFRHFGEDSLINQL